MRKSSRLSVLTPHRQVAHVTMAHAAESLPYDAPTTYWKLSSDARAFATAAAMASTLADSAADAASPSAR